MTVSNLSQAIHFLVTNDFLDGVELKPGQAEEKMIEVVDEQEEAEKEKVKSEPREHHPEALMGAVDGKNAAPLA